MNVQNTTSVDAGLAETTFHFNEATGRVEDLAGNPVEAYVEEVVVTTEGEVASTADVTIH
jgi:hypothetical protein